MATEQKLSFKTMENFKTVTSKVDAVTYNKRSFTRGSGYDL